MGGGFEQLVRKVEFGRCCQFPCKKKKKTYITRFSGIMISESGHSPHLVLNTRKVIFKALHDDSLFSTPYLFINCAMQLQQNN